MYLSTMIGSKDEVLAAAMASPALSARKTHNVEAAFKAVALEVDARAKKYLTDEIFDILEDVYAEYSLTNGEHEALAEHERGDYESGLDDMLETAFEPYVQHLSQNWLGVNTIDTLAYIEAERLKIAASAAKEILSNLVGTRTPAQTLASAGILPHHVEEAYAAHIESNKKGSPVTDTSHFSIHAVVQRIRVHLGTTFDAVEVYDDLQTVIDESDEILVGSAAGRLGLDHADMEALQGAILDMDDAASEIHAMIVNPETVAAAPAPVATTLPPSALPPVAPAATTSSGAVNVIAALKNHGNIGDTEMSERLGISRSTYTNWVKGKAPYTLTAEQHSLVRSFLVAAANASLAAVASLDGAEALTVQ